MSGIKKFLIYTSLAVFIGLLTPSARLLSAQMQVDPEETFAIVQQAISKGDAEIISQYTATYTEVSILGATTMYSRAQTAYILKAFFRDHPPERFIFQNKLRVGKDWYVRGRYWNLGRKSSYGLEMALRWNGRRFEIKSIKIRHLDQP